MKINDKEWDDDSWGCWLTAALEEDEDPTKQQLNFNETEEPEEYEAFCRRDRENDMRRRSEDQKEKVVVCAYAATPKRGRSIGILRARVLECTPYWLRATETEGTNPIVWGCNQSGTDVASNS